MDTFGEVLFALLVAAATAVCLFAAFAGLAAAMTMLTYLTGH